MKTRYAVTLGLIIGFLLGVLYEDLCFHLHGQKGKPALHRVR